MTPTTRLALLRKAAVTECDARTAPDRGAAILGVVAETYRAAAEIYAGDPTLEGCPAGRERDLDLVDEICRQIRALVRSATSARGAERWPLADRWAEAEAIAGRLPVVVARARTVARPDHATLDGSRAISRLWLTASRSAIRSAGEQLQAALTRARSLPHPAPEIDELSNLAERIIKAADDLEAAVGASA